MSEYGNIEDINGILKMSGIMTVRQGSVIVTPCPVGNQLMIHEKLADFAGSDGWLCLTDEVIVVTAGFDFSTLTERIILSGELAKGKKSLHIRQGQCIPGKCEAENSGWLWYEIESDDSGDHIIIDESFIAIPKAGGRKLNYETFWKLEEATGVLAPYASRFAGFTGGVK
jgi:hypothetical protein